MSTPIIRIYNASNTSVQDSWNAGVLDISRSAFESGELVINVWNNKGGNTDVPDLVGCNITTKNINGDNTDEQVVTEKWVHVCVDALASVDEETGRKMFSPIGGNTVCMVAAQGLTEEEQRNGTIKGIANSGSESVSSQNYSKITLKVVPTINATNGVHHFKTRISGYYV